MKTVAPIRSAKRDPAVSNEVTVACLSVLPSRVIGGMRESEVGMMKSRINPVSLVEGNAERFGSGKALQYVHVVSHNGLFLYPVR